MRWTFRQWLEWGEPGIITGEYWIENGFLNFADGDIGDYNHEGAAMEAVVANYADAVSDLADELGLSVNVTRYGEADTEAVTNALQEIYAKLEESMNGDQIDQFIMQNLGCNAEAYAILQGGGDARLYAMKYLGWIAIRSNNVELFGYNAEKQKQIADAVNEILEQEGDETDPANVELAIDDHRTGRNWYTTLAELEQQQVSFRPQQPLTTTYNRYFSTPRDSEENKYSPESKSRINPWNTAAKNAGIGTELWRGTSESYKF